MTADGFDLVLLDKGVDGDAEGGLAIAGAIRRLPEGVGLTPIIALTGNGVHESHARFLARIIHRVGYFGLASVA